MKTKKLKIILGIVAAILLIPLIAMQFTDEVAWSLFDFVIMGMLLLGTGLLMELAWRKASNSTSKIIYLLIIAGVFLLVWAELAVGIFGTPFAGS